MILKYRSSSVFKPDVYLLSSKVSMTVTAPLNSSAVAPPAATSASVATLTGGTSAPSSKDGSASRAAAATCAWISGGREGESSEKSL